MRYAPYAPTDSCHKARLGLLMCSITTLDVPCDQINLVFVMEDMSGPLLAIFLAVRVQVIDVLVSDKRRHGLLEA